MLLPTFLRSSYRNPLMFCLGLIRISPALRLVQISSVPVFLWCRYLSAASVVGAVSLSWVSSFVSYTCSTCEPFLLRLMVFIVFRCVMAPPAGIAGSPTSTPFADSIVPPYHIPPPFVRVRSLTSCPRATCPLSFSMMLFHVLGVICLPTQI